MVQRVERRAQDIRGEKNGELYTRPNDVLAKTTLLQRTLAPLIGPLLLITHTY